MTRYEEIFRASGGNQARLWNTLTMFRAKYGCLPTELHLSYSTLATLVCHHFTPYGFYLLQQKIKIFSEETEEEFLLLAKDERGRTINYGEIYSLNNDDVNNDDVEDAVEDVEEWLGFSFNA